MSLIFSSICVIIFNFFIAVPNKVNINANISENINEEKLLENSLWKIEIPKINLNAQIADGTSSEILDEYVGHFENTPNLDGNVCLAAHNRGYDVNYFEKIKELEIGDKIIYTYENISRTYIVNIKTVIEEIDWKYLENTNENKITLITCVENEPQFRRCIQAVAE